MKLYAALGIYPGDVVAFAGAGGKSSAIRTLAAELTSEGMKVIVAPTTKMFLGEIADVGTLIFSRETSELLSETRKALASSDAVVLGSEKISKDRIGGLAPEVFDQLSSLADVVLVEADGARDRAIKGTAVHEPLLPEASTLVVAVASIVALGKPVGDEYVHRPEVFSDLTGHGMGQSITATAFARALSKGSLGKLPESARAAALVTGVTPGQAMSDAAAVARELWRLDLPKVVFASMSPTQDPQVWTP